MGFPVAPARQYRYGFLGGEEQVGRSQFNQFPPAAQPGQRPRWIAPTGKNEARIRRQVLNRGVKRRAGESLETSLVERLLDIQAAGLLVIMAITLLIVQVAWPVAKTCNPSTVS